MGGGSHYWLARLVFTRTLALVYLIAFLCALNQFRPLLGEHGLQPVADYIGRIPFRDSPSLFYWLPKDWAFAAFAWAGLLYRASRLVESPTPADYLVVFARLGPDLGAVHVLCQREANVLRRLQMRWRVIFNRWKASARPS